MSIEDKLKRIASNHLQIDEGNISRDSVIASDLSADSLDQLELVMAIEDEFNLIIPDKEADKFVTIGDVIKYLKERGVK